MLICGRRRKCEGTNHTDQKGKRGLDHGTDQHRHTGRNGGRASCGRCMKKGNGRIGGLVHEDMQCM